ncbi:MAG TPA: SET domain-containing protein-lysine N-methyltransferase [Kofleriaceae bacterium]|nr:SET domain-containing protein-lysine N-methyltransferase [Kofleriaceae bacterium]
MNGLQVVRSRIHGYGVVATRSYAAGEVITPIDGILYRADAGGDDRGTLWLEGDLYLDILDQMRWLNHSCDPNIWIDGGVREDGTPWAHVVALRAITAAEELTLDYALDAAQAEPCACGAPACRGWIVDEGEAPVVTPRRRRAASARR